MKEDVLGRHYLTFTIISIVGPIIFWLILIITGYLDPQYNPISRSISDLGVGRFGWLQDLNFIIFGLFTLTLGAALFRAFPKSKGIKIVGVLFILMSVGEIVAGLFPVDKSPIRHLSVQAIIHQSGASITAVGYPASIYFLVPIFRRDSNWNDLVNYSLVSGASILALEVGREIFLPTQWLNSWFGLYERILVLISLVWTEVIAVRLLHLCRLKHTRIF